ncbi:restriction endonuclease subunit S [Streptococcus sp. DD12]|uniref:restriction endonuclease subunit S n=1 Tax=Streptococcus sp. DD12 TaxID=1777880 RepID=UPI00079CC6F3|nr:restriction endonuclease subunit S [Streptococcus sp. DD12]KXT76392.1 Type I restriction-modification system specificity subunit [Streptococcus sp. DD12]
MDKIISDYEKLTVNRRPLHQVADIFKGKAISPKDAPGDIAVINLRDIGPLGIEGEDLQSLSGDKRLLQRYLLEDGDLLLASKGTVHKAAVFEEQDFPCVASANIIVVRPGKELSGYYLKFFFESKLGLALLDQASSSQSLLNISSKALGSIEVPIIPLVKQTYLAQRYLQGREDYKRKLSRANQEWQRIQDDITKHLY